MFEADLPPTFPPSLAAVEVAAFRIASEAMTSAARHSGATRCRVELHCGHGLELTVLDNGRGVDRQRARSVAGPSTWLVGYATNGWNLTAKAA